MSEPDFNLIAVPFADLGDKSEIPVKTDPSGNASYTQGWGEDYERDPVTDPSAKRIERGMMNRILNTVTTGLRQYQIAAYPIWSLPVANDGKLLNYPFGARVRYGGKVYASIVDDNNSEPTVSESWVIDDPFDFTAHVASISEVLSGLINNKIVTPATFVQAHREQPFSFTKATGEPNALIAKFSPPVTRLAAGMMLFIQAAQSNTGNVTLQVEDLPAYPVLGVGGVQLPAGSLTPKGVMQVIFTGTEFLSPNLSRASEQYFGITRLASLPETRLGDNAQIAATPKSLAAVSQSGSWVYGSASFDLDKISVSLTPQPQPEAIADGFRLYLQLPTDYSAGVKVNLGAVEGFPLAWTSGAAVQSGQLAKNDLIEIVKIGAFWRVVNSLPASNSRLGMLRTATPADLSAEAAADKAVTAKDFAGGVRSTLLKGLSSGVDSPITVANSVVQAFSNVQAQLRNKGGLKIPNVWTGANRFESGSIDIRGASGASKSIALNDLDGTPRGRVISGSDNLLRLQTFASGAKLGDDLTYSGVMLAKNNASGKRFINREEAATYEETAAMTSWEKYVTPATLGAIAQGVELSFLENNQLQVFTIGRKLRIVIGTLKNSQGSTTVWFPKNFFTMVPSGTADAISSTATTYTARARFFIDRVAIGTGWSGGHGEGAAPNVRILVIGWCG